MFDWLESSMSEIVSFFSGVIVTVFVFVVGPSIREKILSRSEKSEMTEKEKVSTEERYRELLIDALQKAHLSATFFALDEIAVAPIFVLPDSKFEPTLKEDLNEQTVARRWVPFVQTHVNGISMIGDQTISFGELIGEQQRLLVHGEAGVGKSFALAWLALELAKDSGEFAPLTGKVPFFLQANAVIDYLDAMGEDEENDKVPPFYFSDTSTDVRRLFRQSVATNRAVFFVDNVDELSFADQTRLFAWLQENEFISRSAPLMMSVGNEALPDFETLNVFPVALMKFDEGRARAFLSNWQTLWQKFVGNDTFEEAMQTLVENEWLLDGLNVVRPLDLTLRTLAVYLGDVLHPSVRQVVCSMVMREMEGNPVSLQILSRLAVRLHASHQVWFRRGLFAEVYDEVVKTRNEDELNVPKVKAFLESPLFRSSYTGRDEIFRFAHVSLLGFLIGESDEIEDLMNGLAVDWDQWALPKQILGMVIDKPNAKQVVSKLLSGEQGFGQERLLDVFGLMPQMDGGSALFGAFLKNIQSSLRSEKLTKVHKYKLLDLLVPLGRKYTKNVYYPMLKAADVFQQRLGILGCGFNQDGKAAKAIHHVGSQHGSVNADAACLALSLIGTRDSIDLLANYLLSGQFRLQKTAAEALGLNAAQGHAILREGLGLETISVRRACCYGLAHVKEDWGVTVLKDLELNDLEWIVQSAAASTLEFLDSPRFVFGSYEMMHNIPWLIEFASQFDVGVSAGESANKMLFDAVLKGKENFKRAALQYYFYHPSDFGPYAKRLPALIEENGDAEGLQAQLYDLLWSEDTRL